jgi:glycosyltransferase involved in cell wall biosynthesis
VSIGLLAIMLNESDYVARWAESVRRIPNVFDRLLVVDGGSSDATRERLRDVGIESIPRTFENHFADQRNYGLQHIGTDWVLEVDADELVSAPLLGGLPAIVADAERSTADCIGVPRLNLLDGQLVAGPGHKGLDFQYRIHRTSCRWRGAVHEEVVGYRARYELRLDDGHFLIHDKTNERHRARNEYYGTIRP